MSLQKIGEYIGTNSSYTFWPVETVVLRGSLRRLVLLCLRQYMRTLARMLSAYTEKGEVWKSRFVSVV